MDDDGLGWRFWLYVIGIALAIGIGGMILFLIIGGAWYRWGAFGALALFAVVALIFGWIWDRTHDHGYESIEE
jgi:hypothetical protein